MNAKLILLVILSTPLFANGDQKCCQPVEKKDKCRTCRKPNHYWYFDVNYDYNDNPNQQAYWPGKNQSYLYDFITR